MSLFSPSVICLQETFLKQSDNVSFRDFNMFNYICLDGQRASGGTSIMVKSSDFDWSVCDDLHGSDHFPILIEETDSSDDEQHCRWNLKKANWETFTTLCQEQLTPEKFKTAEDMSAFTSALHDISEKCIPKSSSPVPPVHIKSSNGNMCYTTKDISNALGGNFQTNSSSSNYSRPRATRGVEIGGCFSLVAGG